MAWIELDSCEYAKRFPNSLACYLRADFNLLNSAKVDAVRFFAFDKDGLRLGISVGERGNDWLSPYSAPFGGFLRKEDVSIENMDEALKSLVDFTRENGKNLRIVLPPIFYDKSTLSKQVSSFLRAGFSLAYTDLNFAFDLRETYENLLTKRMARRNLKTALSLNYEFRKEESPEGKAIAYDVIRKNREFKNYYLRMSLEDLQKTSSLVDIDYFTLYLDGSPLASAIVYRLSSKIAQVIYWGDVPNDGKSRPMNMIAYKTFQYYKQEGFDYLDIGPSSSEGIPSEGLCSFKETVGCFVDLKYVFELVHKKE